MRALLLILLALPQAGRIRISRSMEESVVIERLTVPASGKVRYHYPKYGVNETYLLRPRCYDIRDEQTGQGTTHPARNINDEGFTLVAPAGHVIAVTCRVVKAVKPLA